MRVLAQVKQDSPVLAQRTCLRCGKAWWPRSQRKPKRCPRCKNPYWDRPRQEKEPPTPKSYEALTKALQEKVYRELGIKVQEERQDQSLAKALAVLKEMKTAGLTWQDMSERVEREFRVRLEKEQLKALVR
jgi:predicted  nucleic acid-binding Zn-ribbon protein